MAVAVAVAVAVGGAAAAALASADELVVLVFVLVVLVSARRTVGASGWWGIAMGHSVGHFTVSGTGV